MTTNQFVYIETRNSQQKKKRQRNQLFIYMHYIQKTEQRKGEIGERYTNGMIFGFNLDLHPRYYCGLYLIPNQPSRVYHKTNTLDCIQSFRSLRWGQRSHLDDDGAWHLYEAALFFFLLYKTPIDSDDKRSHCSCYT